MISNQKQPLVTIVLPTYQRPGFLRRAILSVLNQTCEHLLLTICDNASGDETSEVAAELSKQDSRVVYHCQPKNIGAINNFNFGMAQVKTPFFLLLADDNYLLPEFLEDAISCLTGQSEKTIFVGNVENIDEDGRFISRTLDGWPSGLIHAPDGIFHILESGFPNWEGILFRREQIVDDGLLDSSFGGSVDQEYMVRIAKSYNFYVSKKVCAKFTLHGQSWTSSRALSEFLGTTNRLLERWIRGGSWTADEQRRLRLAVNRNMESGLRGYVIRNAIIGNDLDTLDTAKQFIKDRKELSGKTIAVVKIANLVNTNPVLKWFAAILAKIHLMKNRFKLSFT